MTDLELRNVTIYLTGTRIHMREPVSKFDQQRIRNVLATEKCLV